MLVKPRASLKSELKNKPQEIHLQSMNSAKKTDIPPILKKTMVPVWKITPLKNALIEGIQIRQKQPSLNTPS